MGAAGYYLKISNKIDDKIDDKTDDQIDDKIDDKIYDKIDDKNKMSVWRDKFSSAMFINLFRFKEYLNL